jgi:4-hydroxymandelate oxidase
MGADGLILSNHGGRILDGLPSPLDLIAGVRAALGPSTPLLLDSGVRTGADMAKALALGANAALIGRPVYHALAVAGLAGVAHMLHILRTELEMTMALLGCPTVDALTPERLHPIGARAT